MIIAQPQTSRVCSRFPSPQSSACTPRDTSLSLNLSPPPPPPSFFSSLHSCCVSPSLYFSSGSVVCFQEIRPLLISHMSRVELGKAVCVCVFIVCVYTCVCVCMCVCVRVCTLMYALKVREKESKYRLRLQVFSTCCFFTSAFRGVDSSILQSCLTEGESNINFTVNKLSIFTSVSLYFRNTSPPFFGAETCKNNLSDLLFCEKYFAV